MTDQAIPRATIVVAMPDDIDYGTADQAYDQLYAAFAADVPVVIADFTLTTYCDCTALRRLLAVQSRAAAALRIPVPREVEDGGADGGGSGFAGCPPSLPGARF